MKYTMIGVTVAALAANAYAGGFFSEDEDNNSMALANSLGVFDMPGGTAMVDGSITQGDVDWFSFTLNNTASLSFFAAFSSGNGDGVMQLVTSAGDVIGFDDDSSVALMPALQYENLSAGTYFIALSGFGDVDSSSVDSNELADGSGHSENFSYKLSVGFTIVPAPGALALLGTGGLVMIRRRR